MPRDIPGDGTLKARQFDLAGSCLHLSAVGLASPCLWITGLIGHLQCFGDGQRTCDRPEGPTRKKDRVCMYRLGRWVGGRGARCIQAPYVRRRKAFYLG